MVVSFHIDARLMCVLRAFKSRTIVVNKLYTQNSRRIDVLAEIPIRKVLLSCAVHFVLCFVRRRRSVLHRFICLLSTHVF